MTDRHDSAEARMNKNSPNSDDTAAQSEGGGKNERRDDDADEWISKYLKEMQLNRRPPIIQHSDQTKFHGRLVKVASPEANLRLHFKPIDPKLVRLTEAPAAEDPSTVFQGECYCGKVKLEINRSSRPPDIAVYCHCGDCRLAHASNEYSVFYWFPLVFPTQIVCVAGAELMKYYQRTSTSPVRGFCTECGSRLFNISRFAVGSFPSIFNTMPFNPTAHLHYQECRTREGVTLPAHHDGLIKYMDQRAERGGTGLALQED